MRARTPDRDARAQAAKERFAARRGRQQPRDVLDVAGKARFSTAGTGTIPQGQNSFSVFNNAVTNLSHITVSLVTDPGERHVRWVSRNQGVGFTLFLTTAAPNKRPQTSFTYLIVEPA